MIPLAQVDEARADRERLLVPTVVLDPPDDLDLMREEIFGPILPVRAYPDLEAALADVLSVTGRWHCIPSVMTRRRWNASSARWWPAG